MGTHMIPRNTKGEGRILFIFSTKALILCMAGIGIGLVFNWILGLIGIKYAGYIIIGVLGILGFSIGTFKIPNSEAFKITRAVGGENIDDVFLRYIKFKQKKNKIYITKEEDI